MTRACLIMGVLVALMGLAAAHVAAAPSLYGYTGLLKVPDADALNDQEFNVAYYTLNIEEGADEQIFAANLGVSEGTEIGFARIKPEHGSADTVLSGKYQIQPEDMHRPALAAGIFDLTDEIDTTVYFVASKLLGKPYDIETRGGEVLQPRLHVGIAGGALDGLLLGGTAVLGRKLTLIAEYDSEDVNFGGRLAVGSDIRIHAGWINDLDDIAIGASYNKVF